MIHRYWVVYLVVAVYFYNVTLFAVRCFVCIYAEDDFDSKVPLGIYENLQIGYGGVSHWFVAPVFFLGKLPLLTDSCYGSSLFDGLIASFLHCDYSYLSVLSSSYCCPWPSPHSSVIFAVFFTLGFNDGCIIVWVPPALHSDDKGIIDSELYVAEPFHCSLIILWNVVQACWFFQFVFVSGRHIMYLSYLMLSFKISHSVSPSCPRLSPFRFCNSILINPCSLYCILSPNGMLSSTSMNIVSVVCSMCFCWVSIGVSFMSFDHLNPKVWTVDWSWEISVPLLIRFLYVYLRLK